MITQTVDVHFQGYNRVPQPAASLSFLLPIDTKTNQPPTRCALSPLQSSPQHSQYNHGGALSPLQSSSLTQPFNFLNTDLAQTNRHKSLSASTGLHTYQQDTFFR